MTKKLINLVVILFSIAVLAQMVNAGKPPQRPNYVHTPGQEINLYQPLTKAQMIEDLDFFMDLFLQVHPNPYRFISQQDLQDHFTQIKERIEQLSEPTLPAVEFLFYVYEMTAPIQDEHVQSGFYRWNLDSQFPYQIKILDRQIYVVKSYQEGESLVPISAQILAINEVSGSKLIDQMLLWQNRALDHAKFLSIERNFSLYLYYFYKMTDEFKITYQYQGQTREVVVPALTSISNQSTGSKFIPYQSKHLVVDGADVALLELNTFGIENANEYYQFIDNFFRENRDLEYLIIDIRQNGGGNDAYGYHVLSYIADEPYQITEDYRIKVTDISESYYRYQVDQAYYQHGIPRFLWRFPLYKLTSGTPVWARLQKLEHGEYLELGSVTRSAFDSENKFEGQVYLLFGGHTGSAAINMARVFTYNQLGIAIGSETGHPSSYSGNINSFQMEHSKIGFTLPISFGVAPGGDTRRGVMPDLEVTYTIDDFVQGRDLEMERVEKLIEEGK